MYYISVCLTFLYLSRVYKEASENHVITNVAGGKTVLLKKSNFPDTGITMASIRVYVHE